MPEMMGAGSRVQQAIHEAVADAATALEASANTVKERDLQITLRATLTERLRMRETGCAVDEGEHALDLPQEWPGVGRVDLVVSSPIGDPLVLLELKWGAGTLYNCVWDLAKMGVAVAKGVAPAAYLIAGAPDSDWTSRQLGPELFQARDWSVPYLLDRYRKHWSFWRQDVKTHPLRLPVEVSTADPFAAQLVRDGKPWCIRGVAVTASPEDWLDVESGIRYSRWISRFTWQEGDVEFLTPQEAAQILGDDKHDAE